MPFKRKAKTAKKGGDEEMVDSAGAAPSGTRTARRSASDAFGDEIDPESPLHKKQNTSVARAGLANANANANNQSSGSGGGNNTSIAAGTATATATNKNGEFRTPIDSSGGESVLLHLAPPVQKIPTRPMAALTLTTTTTTASNSTEAEKPVERFGSGAIRGPIKSNGGEPTLETAASSSTRNNSDDLDLDKSGGNGFWKIALLCIANLVVFSVVARTGLLLNERSVHQLELSECRQRLGRVHHLVGLTGGDEFGDNNDDADADADGTTSNRLREQLFYWQELESQVQYWKKEAKRHQKYGEGIKEQCQEDLEHLLTEVLPRAESRRSV